MRTILTKDSQAYRVLALVALSGECAEEALTLLLPQESYRQKVLRRLLEERLLSKYQKDGVKGYRLMRKGKETLLQLEWERFSFYLADGADFSMRRAGLTQRQRQHCISEILAIMERAGRPDADYAESAFAWRIPFLHLFRHAGEGEAAAPSLLQGASGRSRRKKNHLGAEQKIWAA